MKLFSKVVIFFSCLLLSALVYAVEDQNFSSYVKYKVKQGETLPKIFLRLRLKPILSENGYVQKTMKLNPRLKNPEEIRPGTVLVLPIHINDRDFSYDPKDMTVSRTVESVDLEYVDREKFPPPKPQMGKLTFQFDCRRQNDPEVHSTVSKLLQENQHLAEEVHVKFICPDQVIDKEVKIKPWMLSYSKNATDEKGKSLETFHKKSFFFPYVGYGMASYQEGSTFMTEFSNLFVGLHYRQVIDRSIWHVDANIQYGAMTLSNEVENSDVAMLEGDLRVGLGLPIFPEPWRFTLFAGTYYSQMLVTGNLYGYKGTYYPQVYPELRRVFDDSSVLSMSVKYVPTGQGGSVVSLGTRYNFEIFGLDMFVNTTYSDFNFNSTDNGTAVKIKQYNFSLGVGF